MLVVVLSTITNKKKQWIERKRGDETWICGKGLIVFVIVMFTVHTAVVLDYVVHTLVPTVHDM